MIVKYSTRRIKDTLVGLEALMTLLKILKLLEQHFYLVIWSCLPVGLDSSVHSSPVAKQVPGYGTVLSLEESFWMTTVNDYFLIKRLFPNKSFLLSLHSCQ